MVLPWWSSGEDCASSEGGAGSIPGEGTKIPGGGICLLVWQKKMSCWASRSHPIRLHLLGESLRGAAAGGKQLPGGGNQGENHEVTARGILPELRLDLRILPPAVSCLTPKLLMLEIKGSAGRNVWGGPTFPRGNCQHHPVHQDCQALGVL